MLAEPVMGGYPEQPGERRAPPAGARLSAFVIGASVIAALAVPGGLLAIVGFWLGDGNGRVVEPGSPVGVLMDAVFVAWVVVGFATFVLAVLNAALARRSFDAAAHADDVLAQSSLHARGRRHVGALIADAVAAGIFLLLVDGTGILQ